MKRAPVVRCEGCGGWVVPYQKCVTCMIIGGIEGNDE
jgi:hypothetical protein